MRHRITLYSYGTATRSSTGQVTTSPTLVGTYSAYVEPLAGMELMNARQVKAEVSIKIIMRNQMSIKPSDYFTVDGTSRIYNVESVFRVGERNRWYMIHAVEQVGGLS